MGKKQRKEDSQLERDVGLDPKVLQEIKEWEFMYSPRHFTRKLEDCGMNPLLVPIYSRQYLKVYEDVKSILQVKKER